VCAVREGHPAFKSGMSIEAFKSLQHAIPDAGRSGQAGLHRLLEQHGIKRVVRLHVPQYFALLSLVPRTDLLVILPERVAQQFASFYPIQIMPLPLPYKPHKINMYWHARHHNDPPSIWLRQILCSLFDSTPEGGDDAGEEADAADSDAGF
jgi:DNA-binding transcriptional LysR family regulator